MHILGKADRDFNPYKKRDVHNVRRWFLTIGRFSTDIWVIYSISTYSSTSIVSVLCPSRSQWSALTTSTSSTQTGSSMSRHTMMSLSTFKSPPGFWPLSFSGADHAPYSTPELNSINTWASWTMTFLSLMARLAQSDDLDSNVGKDLRSTRVASTAMAVDSERKFDSDFSTAYHVNNDNNSSTAYKNDSDSDSCSAYEPDAKMTAIPMTSAVLGQRRHGRSCTDILPSPSFPTRPLGNLMWSSWRPPFSTSKAKIITHECTQRWLPRWVIFPHLSVSIVKDIGHR